MHIMSLVAISNFCYLYFLFGVDVLYYGFRPANSVHVKYKIFLSAMEYLPFSSGDDSKGSFEEIIERYLNLFCTMFF
jgi:hypothetical protein